MFWLPFLHVPYHLCRVFSSDAPSCSASYIVSSWQALLVSIPFSHFSVPLPFVRLHSSILHPPLSCSLSLCLYYTSSILLSAPFGFLQVPPLWRACVSIVLDLARHRLNLCECPTLAPPLFLIPAPAVLLPSLCACPLLLLQRILFLVVARSSLSAYLGPRSTAIRRRPYHVIGASLRRRTGLLRRLMGDLRRRVRLHTRASTVRDGRAASRRRSRRLRRDGRLADHKMPNYGRRSNARAGGAHAPTTAPTQLLRPTSCAHVSRRQTLRRARELERALRTLSNFATDSATYSRRRQRRRAGPVAPAGRSAAPRTASHARQHRARRSRRIEPPLAPPKPRWPPRRP